MLHLFWNFWWIKRVGGLKVSQHCTDVSSDFLGQFHVESHVTAEFPASLTSHISCMCGIILLLHLCLNQLYSSIRFACGSILCILLFLPSSNDSNYSFSLITRFFKSSVHHACHRFHAEAELTNGQQDICAVLLNCSLLLFAPPDFGAWVWWVQCPFYRKDWRTVAGGSRGEELLWAVSTASCSFEQAYPATQHPLW